MDTARSAQAQGYVIWLTGLSGAGKTTLAIELAKQLDQDYRKCCILDADQLRQGLCQDLGYSDPDRRENVRRMAEVARLMAEAGLITIVAIISPFAAGRAQARQIIGARRFLEVFVDCPLTVCEQRDSKGLYGKARSGVITQFTGLDSDYVPPLRPDVHLNTSQISPQRAAELVMEKFRLEARL